MDYILNWFLDNSFQLSAVGIAIIFIVFIVLIIKQGYFDDTI